MNSDIFQSNQIKVKEAFLANPTLMIYLLQDYFPLSSDLVRRVQNNQKLEHKFMWHNITKNPHINFNDKFLETYKDKIDWNLLSDNSGRFWTISILEKYKDILDWSGHDAYSLMYDSDEGCLSTNEGLPWSDMLIERYEKRWCWRGLSQNSGLPWSIEFIEKYIEKWDWTFLSNNTGIPWSIPLIEKFDDYLDYTVLLGNKSLPWSNSLLLFMMEKKGRWELVLPNSMNYMYIRYMNKGFLYNDSIPWDNELKNYMIERYGDKTWSDKDIIQNYYSAGGIITNLKGLKKINQKWLHWCDFLKLDEKINWDEEMIVYVAENNFEGWKFVSGIVNLSIELVEKLSNHLDWDEVSGSNKNIGNSTFLEKYKYRINYNRLSHNQNLYWDIEFLTKYKNDSLTIPWGQVNNSLNLPYSVDFVKDFADKLYRPVLPAWEIVKPYVDDNLIYSVLSRN